MRIKGRKLVVSFYTTAEAFAFEAACKRGKVPGRLGTVPRQMSAGCGMAWYADLADRDSIEHLIEAENLEYEEMAEIER